MTAFPCWNSSVHCGLWAVMSRGGWWWGRWLYTPHLTLELYRGVCMCVYEYTVNQMLSMSHFRISFIYMSHTTAPFSVIIWKGIFLPSIFFLYPDLSATTVQLQLQYDWVTLSTQQPPPPMPSPEAPRLRQGLSVCHRGFLLCSFFLLSISLVVLSPFLLLYLGPISECFCSLSCFTQQPVKAVIGLWCNKANTHGGHSPGAFKGRIMVLRIQSSDLPPRAKSCYCVSRCGLVWWGECPLEESSSRMLKDLLVF